VSTPLADDRPPFPGAQEIHLRQYWPVVRRHWRPAGAVFLGASALGALLALQGTNRYRATSQLMVDREDPVVVSFRTVTDVNERGWSDEFFQTQSKMVGSRGVALDVIRTMGLLQRPEFGGPRDPRAVEAALAAPPGQSPILEGVLSNVMACVDVDWLRGTRLINVSYEAPDPALAASLADGVAQAYIRSVRATRHQAASEAAAWLAEQIEAQRAKVAEAEKALQVRRDRDQLVEGIVAVDDRRTMMDQRLRDLAAARNQARARRLEREALYQEMKAAPTPLELPDVLRNPVISQLRVDQATLERRLAMLDEKYLDQHPTVVEVRSQLDETKRKLEAEARQVVRAAENDSRAAAAQEASLDRALEQAKAEYESLTDRTVAYDVGRRDLEAAKTVLASLTARFKETDVSQDLQAVHVRVAQSAAPPRQPFAPRRLLKALAGLVAGLVGGVALALLKDGMDDTVRTPDDVRLTLHLPLLSVVPQSRAANGAPLLADTGGGDFVEPSRLLRSHVEQALDGAPGGRVVMLTSTSPGEGKTLTTANLALSLVRGAQRVLLVDADMRQGAASRLLDSAERPGLAELLAGRADFASVVRRSGRGLDVLPAGGSGSEDFLSARTVKPLLSALRAAYDWVVVDTPPVGAVADALVLAPLVDGVLLVVQAERVPRPAAVLTAERLAAAGGRLLGVVLNRAPVERYPYEYGFHYGRYGRPPVPLPAAPGREDAAAP